VGGGRGARHAHTINKQNIRDPHTHTHSQAQNKSAIVGNCAISTAMVCGIMRLCAVRVWVCVCVSQRVLRMALKEWNGGNGAGEAPGRPQSFNWGRGSNVANFRSTPDSISISISHSKGVPLTDNHPHRRRRRSRRPRWVSVYYYRLIDTASGVTTVQSLGIHFIASHFRRQSIGHMRCIQFKKEC